MRAVLDTNVWISALISSGGVPAQIIASRVYFSLLFSQEMLDELERVLHYPYILKRHGLSADEIHDYVRRLSATSEVVNVTTEAAAISRDPDDDMFLICAIAGKADFVVSGDRHLLELGNYEGIPIITPAAFLALLNSSLHDR